MLTLLQNFISVHRLLWEIDMEPKKHNFLKRVCCLKKIAILCQENINRQQKTEIYFYKAYGVAVNNESLLFD